MYVSTFWSPGAANLPWFAAKRPGFAAHVDDESCWFDCMLTHTHALLRADLIAHHACRDWVEEADLALL